MGLPQGMSREEGLEQGRFRQIPIQAAVGADLVSARRAHRQFIQGFGKFGWGTGRTQGPPLHANTGKLAEKFSFF